MRFAQILYGKAHWVFEVNEQPQFAPNIILVDITEKPEVQEGWSYNASTNTFSEPYIEEDINNLLAPNEDAILDAKVELKVIETLIELEVI